MPTNLRSVVFQSVDHVEERLPQCGHVDRPTGLTRSLYVGDALVARGRCPGAAFAARRIEAIARAVDREPLFVQQLANPPNQQHFVMLVIPAVTAPLHRPQLRELLFPVAQHMRLDPAQLADFADREVALRGNRRQDDFLNRVGHRRLTVGKGRAAAARGHRRAGVTPRRFRPAPSASGSRGT
ncbi:hypothetical protein BVI2075_230198 [Burkholderia vietnamiensis]|nr:hypothetical protein BVI2075_230198 [Burkholderia vietnamiensis]